MSDKIDFKRQPGQVGLKIMVMEAKPNDMSEFGSEKFMITELTDKVNKVIVGFEIRPLKVHLVAHHGISKDCIIEPFVKGPFLPVGFSTMDALEDLWKSHKNGNLDKAAAPYLQSLLTKPTNCSSITLRLTCDEEEYKECRAELLSKGIMKLDLEEEVEAKKMLRYIKKYQDKEFTALIDHLRDDELKLDKTLGVFLTTAKHHIPESSIQFKTRKEFNKCIENAKKKKDKDIQVLLQYDGFIADLKNVCKVIHEHIFASFDQIHISCHRNEQKEIQKELHQMVKQVEEWLHEDYVWMKMKHPNWIVKVLPREQQYFGGVVSLFPCAMEVLVDFDHKLDEYFELVKVKY